MAIGRFVAEALAEGVVFRFFYRLWDVLKSGIGHPVAEELVKSGLSQLKPRGLDDESVFAYILSKAEMPREKRIQLVNVLNRLEREDKANKTKYARNFRLIVAIDALGRGIIKAEKGGEEGEKVRKEPDSEYQHPGLGVLEALAEECDTEQDMVMFIVATGAMQDAPFGKLDEFQHWAKKEEIPFVINAAKKLDAAGGDAIIALAEHINRQYDEREARISDWRRLSKKEKIKKPWRLWRRFLDQF